MSSPSVTYRNIDDSQNADTLMNIMKEDDFLIGNCSSSSIEDTPNLKLDEPLAAFVTVSAASPAAPSGCCIAYEECIRILTRQLRQTPKRNGPKCDCKDPSANTATATNDDDCNEEFFTASQGIPELLALQNTILQFQHAFYLLQQEATTAIHDANIALQSSQYWQHEYHTAKQSVITLEHNNQLLQQQNERLMTEKRKLKAACKKLVTQHHTLQSQQVESYVVSALMTHEQCLQLGTTSTNSSYIGKNRSRATTLETTTTSALGDDYTTSLDDPFTNTTNSPNCNTTVDTTFDIGGDSSKVSSETKVMNSTSKIPLISAPSSSIAPPTIVTTTMNEHHNRLSPNRGKNNNRNGFGNAFGRTFQFIENHVVHNNNKKESSQQHRQHNDVSNNAVESKCKISNDSNDGDTVAVVVPAAETEIIGSTYSPRMTQEYAPIRLDVITPTRSIDSQDSAHLHYTTRKRSSPTAGSTNKALIDVNTLLDGPIDDSNDHMERSLHQSSMSDDRILLSLPILPHSYGNGNDTNGSLKSVSPISIPEEADEDETTLYLHDHPSSTLQIKCQRYTCDPSLLRSLSIPTIPMHAAPTSTSSDLNVKHY